MLPTYTAAVLCCAMQNLESFVAVLLALKRFLAPPGYDPAAAAAADGAGEVAPKLAALGLVNPPAAAITAAVNLSGHLPPSLPRWLWGKPFVACVRHVTVTISQQMLATAASR